MTHRLVLSLPVWSFAFWAFRRNYAEISLFLPEADKVELVFDESNLRFQLSQDALGIWKVRIKDAERRFHGHIYHLEVFRGDEVSSYADPFAALTERLPDRIVSRFNDLSGPALRQYYFPPRFRDIVIYEAHLPALTRHESAPVTNESHRGTFKGVLSAGILEHLRKLDVAVEFLPLHARDALLGQDWGYFTTSFHAITMRYAAKSYDANQELMEMIDRLHLNGNLVLLDVVFNHGAELWVKVWGEDIIYRKLDSGHWDQGSGCGPTVETEHPLVRQMIIDTLLHLVKTYRFDGFRFDLGALHDKETMIQIDAALPSRIALIAEPWALGGTKWGKGDLHTDLKDTRWAVWNDDFREPGIKLVCGTGDFHNRDRLMRAIKGSHVDDGGWTLRPQQSINYLTSHDGKTLSDLVAGDEKRQLLGVMLMLCSQGVPMISEGTEMMYSKQGEHNTYNRVDLNQLNWESLEAYPKLFESVCELVKIRKLHSHFKYTTKLRERSTEPNDWDIDWIYPTGYPHNDNVNAIGFQLRAPRPSVPWMFWRGRNRVPPLIVLLNGSSIGASFNLPPGSWKVLADGSRLEVNVNGLDVPYAQETYYVHPGTGVLLSFASSSMTVVRS